MQLQSDDLPSPPGKGLETTVGPLPPERLRMGSPKIVEGKDRLVHDKVRRKT
jgi:hypothetical protein